MCTNECLKQLRFSGSNKKYSFQDFDYDYTYTCDKHQEVWHPGRGIIRCQVCAEWTFEINLRMCPACRTAELVEKEQRQKQMKETKRQESKARKSDLAILKKIKVLLGHEEEESKVS